MSDFEHIKGYQKDIDNGKAIVIIWTSNDIIVRAEDLNLKITNEESIEILSGIEKNHDACNGITWDHIDAGIEYAICSRKLNGADDVVELTVNKLTFESSLRITMEDDSFDHDEDVEYDEVVFASQELCSTLEDKINEEHAGVSYTSCMNGMIDPDNTTVKVDSRDGTAFLVVTVEISGEPSEEEVKEFLSELDGGYSDGWGEGFEQAPFKKNFGEEYYASAWTRDRENIKVVESTWGLDMEPSTSELGM